jgi:hypothetical protein
MGAEKRRLRNDPVGVDLVLEVVDPIAPTMN